MSYHVRSSSLSPKWWVAFAGSLAYALMVFVLAPRLGPVAGVFSLPWAAVAGWFLGRRPAAYVVLAAVLANVLAYQSAMHLPAMANYSPLSDALGNAVTILIGTSFSWARRLLLRLRFQAEQLQELGAAVRSTREGIAITDARLEAGGPTLLFANDGFCRLAGQSSTLRGVPIWPLLGASPTAPWVREACAALAGGQSFSGQVQLEWPSRPSTFLDVSIDGIQDQRGRVTRLVVVLRDITTVKQLELQLSHQAWHDALTGLPNRTLFEDRLERAIAVSSRGAPGFTLMFLDLDGFKQVNDAHGHDTGDALLRQVAARLTETLHPGDVVARMGGDEFTVLTNRHAPQEVLLVAHDILRALSRPFEVDGQPLQVSASIGLSGYPQDSRDAATLQRHADVAMYQAKRAGKNRVVRFSSEFSSSQHFR